MRATVACEPVTASIAECRSDLDSENVAKQVFGWSGGGREGQGSGGHCSGSQGRKLRDHEEDGSSVSLGCWGRGGLNCDLTGCRAAVALDALESKRGGSYRVVAIGGLLSVDVSRETTARGIGCISRAHPMVAGEVCQCRLTGTEKSHH